MPKRKVKQTKSLSENTSYSGSDSEYEEIPAKYVRNDIHSSIVCSTPLPSTSHTSADHVNFSSDSEDVEEVEKTNSTKNCSKYDSYSSFLKVFSLGSDSEEDNDGISAEINNSGYNDGNQQRAAAYESPRFLMETTEKNARIIAVPSKNLEIVSLLHPSSVTVEGYLKVSSLLGRASILGHDIPEGESVKVFSTENTTFLKVCTVKSIHLSNIQSLRKKLSKYMTEDKKVDEFLESIGPTTVVIVVEKDVLPPSLQFLELYYPFSVHTRRFSKTNEKKSKSIKQNEYLCTVEEKESFVITADMESIAEEIKKAKSKSVTEDYGFGPRIVVYGTKRAGKSSLLRYLINKTLNEFPYVFYLDIDPGQTEFTPPGVVSLVKISEPLLGPPFCHQQKPLKMVCTGSVSAKTSPPMYVNSVIGLIEIFKTKFPQEILFVNTMGWIKGIGGICLDNVVTYLDPTIMIKLLPQDQLPAIRTERLSGGNLIICLPAREPSEQKFSSVQSRNFALMSYFGKCQKYYKEPTYLHEFRPFVVCWDNIAIYVVGEKVPCNRLVEAVHCSVVALCRVNEDLILESDKSEFPRTLLDEPLNECLGFGVVRASDETHHLLYIVTPLSLEELKCVNAIIKGEVLLPDIAYIKQPILNIPLPYTDSSKGELAPKTV